MTDTTTEEAVRVIHELGESDFRFVVRELLQRRSQLYRGGGKHAMAIRNALTTTVDQFDRAFLGIGDI